MNDYQSFLDQVTAIAKRAEEKKRNAFNSGNAFNLFHATGIDRKEVFHTKYLTSLLDPQGEHGMGPLFLGLFLSRYKKMTSINLTTAIVESEYVISDISEDKKRGGRIDILIRDSFNHAIIIENKLDADDQTNQLLRYYNFGRDSKLDFSIIYLTLDMHSATEKSIGKRDLDYVLYSYKEDIIPWLEECDSHLPKGSQIQLSNQQYINHLKNINHLMDNEDLEELKTLMVQPQNSKACLTLLENQSLVVEAIRNRFIERIAEVGRTMKYEVSIDDGFGKEPEAYICFSKPRITQDWAVWIWSVKGNWSDFCFSLSMYEGKKNPLLKKDIEKLPRIWTEFVQTKDNPFGWGYFYSESGKRGSGHWNDWNDLETVKAMEDGRLEKFIIERILNPVIENRAFQKLK